MYMFMFFNWIDIFHTDSQSPLSWFLTNLIVTLHYHQKRHDVTNLASQTKNTFNKKV